jgi:hypothetical protein
MKELVFLIKFINNALQNKKPFLEWKRLFFRIKNPLVLESELQIPTSWSRDLKFRKAGIVRGLRFI